MDRKAKIISELKSALSEEDAALPASPTRPRLLALIGGVVVGVLLIWGITQIVLASNQERASSVVIVTTPSVLESELLVQKKAANDELANDSILDSWLFND